jgi:GTP pyrophosphokinase
MESTKLELHRDMVFCFSPKGDLIELPQGSTPVDFAYHVHSQVGDACVGAKVNGRIVRLHDKLRTATRSRSSRPRAASPTRPG